MAAVAYIPAGMQAYPQPMSPMVMMTVASPVRQEPQPWRAPFCSCMDDPASCCMAWCFPCVLFGQNAQKIDGSGCFCNCCLYACCMACYGCQCLVHAGKKTGLRIKYNLRPEPCDDCLVAWCCPCCALSQEARELQARANDNPGPTQQVMMVMSPGGGVPVSSPTTINVHTNNNNGSPPAYSTPNGSMYPNSQMAGGPPANYVDGNNQHQYANNGYTMAQPVKQFNYPTDGGSPTFNDYNQQPTEAYRISGGGPEGQANIESPYGSTQVLKTV